jgi:HAD domain in Swiss Army Knife RNA repair proteins
MLLFLDCDGVLNSINWFHFRGTVEGKKRREFFFNNYEGRTALELHLLEPECVSRVSKLVHSVGAKVVISSTWREGSSPEHFESLFKELGAELPKNTIIGLTPIMDEVDSYKRATEINTWISANKYKGAYLILDDEDKFFDDQPSYRTDHKVGITDNDITAIKEMISVKR